MATGNVALTATVAPGAVAKPVLLASAGNTVKNVGPADVHVAPSDE